MRIELSNDERTALLKAWKNKYIETDGLKSLCLKMAVAINQSSSQTLHPYVRAMLELDDLINSLDDITLSNQPKKG